jgi:hypothetical protein
VRGQLFQGQPVDALTRPLPFFAYQMLESTHTTQSVIDELFTGESPVALPTFDPPLSSSQGAESSTSYVDVAFEITKYGESRRIEIL